MKREDAGRIGVRGAGVGVVRFERVGVGAVKGVGELELEM